MKILKGKVVSTKMKKTIVVEISHARLHPLYKKVMKHHTKIKAHSEDSSIKEGDIVEIASSKPISKDKHYRLVKKI